jgi:hypothetical protein
MHIGPGTDDHVTGGDLRILDGLLHGVDHPARYAGLLQWFDPVGGRARAKRLLEHRRPGAEVLDDHIGPAHHLAQDLAVRLPVDVERNALPASIDHTEKHGLFLDHGWKHASGVTGRWTLDLDHPRSELRQQHGAEGGLMSYPDIQVIVPRPTPMSHSAVGLDRDRAAGRDCSPTPSTAMAPDTVSERPRCHVVPPAGREACPCRYPITRPGTDRCTLHMEYPGRRVDVRHWCAAWRPVLNAPCQAYVVPGSAFCLGT